MIQNYCDCRPSALATLPLERACALLGLDRSGFYRNTGTQLPLEDETVLREAIENIVVEFSGYGYRRVTAALPPNLSATGGTSTTNGCCGLCKRKAYFAI